MNSSLSFHSPNSYKFYFSPNSNPPIPNTHHNKQNLPNSANKPRYEFYFKKPSSSNSEHSNTPKQIPLQVHSQTVPDSTFPKAISHLIDFTQMASLSFQSFLGAAIVFFKLKQKTIIHTEQIPTITLSCLFISSKLYEIQELSVSQITSMTGNTVSKQAILHFEGWIMEKLEFDLLLENHLQKTFENIFSQALTLNEDAMGNVEMLIQMCLLRGNQIFADSKYIKWIGRFVMEQKSDQKELYQLKKYLNGLKSSHQMRSLLLKWSFKIDTDSTVSKLQM